MKAYPGGESVPRRVQEGLRHREPGSVLDLRYGSAEGRPPRSGVGQGRPERRSLRAAMVEALFNTKNLHTVLGTFGIDSAGDTT